MAKNLNIQVLEKLAADLTPTECLIAERVAIAYLSRGGERQRSDFMVIDAWIIGIEFATFARTVKESAIKAQDEKIAVREALYRGEG